MATVATINNTTSQDHQAHLPSDPNIDKTLNIYPQSQTWTESDERDNMSPNPRYGERLLVHTVDDLARDDPDRIWATVTLTNDMEDGFRDFTVKDLANAVNNVAWWLDGQIGRSNNFEVLAYIGNSDVRYAILLFAAIKCGYQLMVPSIRNAEAGNLHVLEKANCSKLFHSTELKPMAMSLKEKKSGLEIFQIAEIDKLVDTPAKYYPYEKTWADAWKEPVIIAHSSGSTGFPKAITITNGVLSFYDSLRKIPQIPGRRNQDNSMFNFKGGGRFYNPYPPFHLAGLFAMTYLPIFYTCTVLMGPPLKPPTGEMLSSIMKEYKICAAWCPPTVIEQLLEIPGGYEQAASLDFIMYTGGPLAPAVGDRLSKVTDLCQLYGSTETGTQVGLVPKRENWNYFEWHPYLANEMDPVGDGTYEMVIHKNPDLLWFRQIYHTFPELDIYRTNDLFIKHPTKPNLWRFHGRRDDVIVLSNGEKFNPVIMEGVIAGHRLVRGALIVGAGRFQATLLLEPVPNHGLSISELINEVWPTIKKANHEGPGHGQIFRSKIIVARPDKPFIRAGKGTIIRPMTTILYEKEVEEVYNNADTDRTDRVPKLTLPCDPETIKKDVRSCVTVFLSNIGNGDDLFVAGLDSLQTLELTNDLKAWLKTEPEVGKKLSFSMKNIYENPTIDSLTSFFDESLNHNSHSVEDNKDRATKRTESMSAMVDRFTKGFSQDTKLNIILTGSTGSLGTHLLQILLSEPKVEKIYCLNRSATAQERHEKNFISRGLKSNLSKAEFLQVDFGSTNFGLSETTFTELKTNTHFIIHNAWKVDFNHQLSSFAEVHIRGVQNFVNLCRRSPLNPHLLFVSSVSSVQNWAACYGSEIPVPETVIENYNVALEMGYGESKHVSERIMQAATKAGVRSSILRVGQIGGPLAKNGGEWNRSEWFPTLLKTSKTLGCIPNTLGSIDWIPVDSLANIIIDIIHGLNETGTGRVFNLINPTSADWDTLLPVFQEIWGVKPVSFTEWVNLLKGFDQRDLGKVISMPALKILDFYEAMAIDLNESKNRSLEFSTANGKAMSRTMRELAPINKEALRIWLDQWNF